MTEAAWSQLPEGQRLGVLQQIGADWVKGPGEPLMQALLNVSRHEGGILWVVEDLGADMDEVYKLRDALGLPGMRVVQFFGYDDQGRANPHVDPAQYPENSLAMSDTHDLAPLRAWVVSLSAQDRGRIASVYGISYVNELEFERKILEKLLACPSRWVMLSLQTILGLGEGHRINTPGTVGFQNWTWRMPLTLSDLPDASWLLELIEKSKRRAGA